MAILSGFLDAPSHLYKRVCPSVRVSVRPSVSILKNAVYRVLGASYAGYPALFASQSLLLKNQQKKKWMNSFFHPLIGWFFIIIPWSWVVLFFLIVVGHLSRVMGRVWILLLLLLLLLLLVLLLLFLWLVYELVVTHSLQKSPVRMRQRSATTQETKKDHP